MERGLIINLWTALSVKLPTRNQRLNQACSFLSAEAGITDLVSSCGSPPGFGTCVCFGWKQSRLLKDTQEVSFRRVGAHPLFFPCQAVFVRAVTECLFLWPVCQSINKTHHEKGNRMQPAVTHLGNAIFMLIHDSAVGMTYEWWVILLRIVQFGLNRKRVSSSCIKSRRLEHICGALMSRRSERSCFMHIRKPRRCITSADGSAALGCRKSPIPDTEGWLRADVLQCWRKRGEFGTPSLWRSRRQSKALRRKQPIGWREEVTEV